jgi:hypothetical protein
MLDALKILFENNVVSEEVRAEIEEAWNAKIRENRQAVTAELREEFARKYEHDKEVMVEAIDSLISESLASEISEFVEDRKQLAEAKAKMMVAMKENFNSLNKFIAEQLASEIKELREDKKVYAQKQAKLEEFVVESLSTEISEFYEDKKDLTETKVRLVKEAKEGFNKIKRDFIEQSATMVSEMVSNALTKEIKTLKEDIDMARKNDFGRKLFEAFASEYSHSYLNEKSETSKLLKVVDLKDKQLAEARAVAVKAKKLAESKDFENKKLMESAKREKMLNDLVSPLSKDQKSIMIDLLESVQTNRLPSAFEKYLPAIIDGNAPAKKKAQLNEGKVITGNRENNNNNVSSSKADDNVFDIRRLAGLS